MCLLVTGRTMFQMSYLMTTGENRPVGLLEAITEWQPRIIIVPNLALQLMQKKMMCEFSLSDTGLILAVCDEKNLIIDFYPL